MTAPSCLILDIPRDLRTAEGSVLDSGGVPRHAHRVHVADALQAAGIDVSFTDPTRRRIASLLAAARRHDAVLGYDTAGALALDALSLLPGSPPGVFVTMTLPRGLPLVARRLWELAVRRSKAVVCNFWDLVQECRSRTEDVFYSPTGADSAFFDPALVDPRDASGELKPLEFVLAVGDSSRDDEFMYEALREIEQPIVRVTRDPAVIERISRPGGGLRPDRGDRLLSRVSFPSLRWLYANAAVHVVTSSLDRSQAAGSTSLAEAMACGSVCAVAAGGCLESEWRHLSAEVGMAPPVLFFDPWSATGLRGVVEEVCAYDRSRRETVGAAARKFAIDAFPVERSHRAFVDAVGSVVRGTAKDPG